MIQKFSPPMEEVLGRTAAELRAFLPAPPAWAVVPGTGAREFLDALDEAAPLPASELAPGYVPGDLFLGKKKERLLLLADPPRDPWKGGRPEEILFLFRLLSLLGAQELFLTAAGASLDGSVPPGRLALASDHLNFTEVRPLRHPASQEGAWPLFPDMTRAYPADLRERIRSLAQCRGVEIPDRVYAGVPGPSLPTPAEFRFYKDAGASVVSMSGPPWVEAAVQAGLETALLLAVTQEVDTSAPLPVDLEAVLASAETAAGSLVEIAFALVEEESEEE